MFRNNILRQQPLTSDFTIAVCERVRSTQVHALDWRSVEVSFYAPRQSTRTILKTTEATQPERIDSKSRKSNHTLETRVKVSRTKQDTVAGKSLIEAAIDAD